MVSRPLLVLIVIAFAGCLYLADVPESVYYDKKIGERFADERPMMERLPAPYVSPSGELHFFLWKHQIYAYTGPDTAKTGAKGIVNTSVVHYIFKNSKAERIHLPNVGFSDYQVSCICRPSSPKATPGFVLAERNGEKWLFLHKGESWIRTREISSSGDPGYWETSRHNNFPYCFIGEDEHLDYPKFGYVEAPYGEAPNTVVIKLKDSDGKWFQVLKGFLAGVLDYHVLADMQYTVAHFSSDDEKIFLLFRLQNNLLHTDTLLNTEKTPITGGVGFHFNKIGSHLYLLEDRFDSARLISVQDFPLQKPSFTKISGMPAADTDSNINSKDPDSPGMSVYDTFDRLAIEAGDGGCLHTAGKLENLDSMHIVLKWALTYQNTCEAGAVDTIPFDSQGDSARIQFLQFKVLPGNNPCFIALLGWGRQYTPKGRRTYYFPGGETLDYFGINYRKLYAVVKQGGKWRWLLLDQDDIKIFDDDIYRVW